MKRVLLVSNDDVGEQMAGPGIRYYQFAKQLSQHFEVTLMAPTAPRTPLGSFEILEARSWQGRRFRALVKQFDVVVAQGLRPWTMRALAASDVLVVYDLYDPSLVGNLALAADGDGSRRYRRAAFRAPAVLQELALASGNAFICASERQRDFWLGMLAAIGRIEPERAIADPALRDLIDVVPFGLEPEPPIVESRALKGVVPGIEEADRVVLWGGGIWKWLDPLTPIRAVHALSQRRSDVKLFFLGVEHPNPSLRRTAMTAEAVELSESLRLSDRYVFFNFDWVPYARRAEYLLDADIGISGHLDTLETRFSFRTRIVDYFWAGLPTVATEGDVLSDLVHERNLGRAVRFGDVDGWVAAIEELLDDQGELERVRGNVEHVRDDFRWSNVVGPLARLASLPGGAIKPTRSLAALASRYDASALHEVLLRNGTVGGVREVHRNLRRPRLP